MYQVVITLTLMVEGPLLDGTGTWVDTASVKLLCLAPS